MQRLGEFAAQREHLGVGGDVLLHPGHGLHVLGVDHPRVVHAGGSDDKHRGQRDHTGVADRVPQHRPEPAAGLGQVDGPDDREPREAEQRNPEDAFRTVGVRGEQPHRAGRGQREPQGHAVAETDQGDERGDADAHERDGRHPERDPVDEIRGEGAGTWPGGRPEVRENVEQLAEGHVRLQHAAVEQRPDHGGSRQHQRRPPQLHQPHHHQGDADQHRQEGTELMGGGDGDREHQGGPDPRPLQARAVSQQRRGGGRHERQADHLGGVEAGGEAGTEREHQPRPPGTFLVDEVACQLRDRQAVHARADGTEHGGVHHQVRPARGLLHQRAGREKTRVGLVDPGLAVQAPIVDQQVHQPDVAGRHLHRRGAVHHGLGHRDDGCQQHDAPAAPTDAGERPAHGEHDRAQPEEPQRAGGQGGAVEGGGLVLRGRGDHRDEETGRGNADRPDHRPSRPVHPRRVQPRWSFARHPHRDRRRGEQDQRGHHPWMPETGERHRQRTQDQHRQAADEPGQDEIETTQPVHQPDRQTGNGVQQNGHQHPLETAVAAGERQHHTHEPEKGHEQRQPELVQQVLGVPGGRRDGGGFHLRVGNDGDTRGNGGCLQYREPGARHHGLGGGGHHGGHSH